MATGTDYVTLAFAGLKAPARTFTVTVPAAAFELNTVTDAPAAVTGAADGVYTLTVTPTATTVTEGDAVVLNVAAAALPVAKTPVNITLKDKTSGATKTFLLPNDNTTTALGSWQITNVAGNVNIEVSKIEAVATPKTTSVIESAKAAGATGAWAEDDAVKLWFDTKIASVTATADTAANIKSVTVTDDGMSITIPISSDGATAIATTPEDIGIVVKTAGNVTSQETITVTVTHNLAATVAVA